MFFSGLVIIVYALLNLGSTYLVEMYEVIIIIIISTAFIDLPLTLTLTRSLWLTKTTTNPHQPDGLV